MWLKVVSEKIPLDFFLFFLSFFAIFVPWFFIGTQSGGTNCWSNEFAHLESLDYFKYLKSYFLQFKSDCIPTTPMEFLVLYQSFWCLFIYYLKAHKSVKRQRYSKKLNAIVTQESFQNAILIVENDFKNTFSEKNCRGEKMFIPPKKEEPS